MQQSYNLSPDHASPSWRYHSGSRPRRQDSRNSASSTLTPATSKYPEMEGPSSHQLSALPQPSIFVSGPGSSRDFPEREHESTTQRKPSIRQSIPSSCNSLRSQFEGANDNQEERSFNDGITATVEVSSSVPENGDLEFCGSSIYSNATETTHFERHLGTFDVAALIINKVIGGGIFTTPGLVLSLTKSKSIALGLWVVGGVYTALWCVLLFTSRHSSATLRRNIMLRILAC